MSQMRVRKIGMERIFLKIMSQLPGFGKNLIQFGKRVNKINGLANPNPIEMKIRIEFKLGIRNAAVIAVPIKGAAQGVAIRVVKTPIKNADLMG